MKNINIKFIKHKNQKYDTAGNYGKNWFEISKDLGDDSAFMIMIHELVEYYLCKKRGIKLKDIDNWDIKGVFIKDPKNQNDPGISKYSPYHKEHIFATKIEKILCEELGLNWEKYNKSFDLLIWK